MPLDWSQVVKRYGAGAMVPTITGGKHLHVTKATEDAIYIECPIWSARLAREDLEKGVTLIEDGTISTDPGLFVEDYMIYVSNNRATSVAHILRDLGFLDLTGDVFRQMLKAAPSPIFAIAGSTGRTRVNVRRITQ